MTTIAEIPSSSATVSSIIVNNAVGRYHDELQRVLAASSPDPATQTGFDPGWELPPLDADLERFLAPSTINWHPLGEVGGLNLSVLDLRSNPSTRTTKTIPSLVMVARAVHHIRRTGERIVIVTPSSANKATALRDAVLRAIETGLVEATQLQIVSVVPLDAQPKLWRSALSDDEYLRARNPILLYDGSTRDGVKHLVQGLARTEASSIEQRANVRLWFTLDINNYRVADALRAFVEEDSLPDVPYRLHAHSVSSAFGLIGHAFGVQHRQRSHPKAGYFLVQHLDTPDMVLDLCTGSFERTGLPAYRFDERDALYRQDCDPHFPLTTYSVDEVLDPTFYTHRPLTQSTMRELIGRNGGGGIVVSLYECLQRYAMIRQALAAAHIDLPADPRQLREWSLVMAMTGILNAAQRRLIQPGTDVMVHASGSYSSTDYQPIPPHHLSHLGPEGRDLAGLVRAATQS